MGKKKPIVSSLGQWAYPGEVTIIPSNSITMKGVGYPVLGVDNLGNSQMMMPGADYTFSGDYVTEIPQMGKGGLTQWFAEEWTDVKTGKPCGRSGKEKGSRPYPACRPKKRVNETTPKTTSEMSSAEKARFKREKTSGKRIDYNHKRRKDGGETWLDQYQFGSERLPIKPEQIVNSKLFRPTFNTEYNSPLLPGGTKEIQEYQKKLNQQYGTFLDEDGIWGEETQKAYQKFKVDKEKGQSNNLKYRPTLSEFKSFYEKIPSYNSGYESIYDVNPNMSAVQEGPLTKERFNQISSLPNENDLINQYRGKTFGSLPVIEGAGLYEGYSPSRIWTGYTPFLPNKKGTSELRKDSSDKSDLHDASYLYFLAPKNEDLTSDYVNNVDISAKDIFDIEGSIVKGVKDPVAAKQLYDFLNKNKTVKERIKNLNLPEYEKFTNDDWRELLEASTLKSGSWTFNKEAPVYWKQWREFGDELLQNPDIIKYAKDNNIDLSQITNVPFNNKNRAKSSSYVNYDEPLYSSQLIEGIMAQRDAKINKRVSGSGTGDGYSVIQDPSKYNFYGYTPIQPGETLDNLKASSARNLYMTRAGVPNDPKLREQILIHTSRFPIQEYVPSKKYGGWLEQYQEGGENDIRMEPIQINTQQSPWYIRYPRKALRAADAKLKDWGHQYAQRIAEATGGKDWYKQPNSVLRGIWSAGPGFVFEAPQLTATYAATGKVQTPSEAMNIQNPYGAFAVDALLDPMNVVGVGVSSTARNLFSQIPDQLNSSITRQINKNPGLALSLQRGRPINTSNVNVISGINPGDVSAFPDIVKRVKPNTVSESTFFKQLEKGAGSLDSSLQKRISDLESKEGFKRLVDQEKDYLFYNSDLPEDTIERVAKINARSRIDELKNITNVNKEASEYASANFLNAGLPNPFTDNYFLYNNAFYKSGADDVISDIVSKSKGINLVKPTPNYSKSVPGEIGIGYNYVGSKPIEMHEIGHVLQRGRKLSIDDQLKNITPKKQLSADQQRVYNYFTKGSRGTEPSAFANELRESMLQKGFIPDYYSPISQQQVQDAYTYFKKNPIGTYDKNTGKFLSSTRIFDFMNATKSNSKLLSDILNKLPAVTPIGIGAAGVAQLPEQKYGGWLEEYQDGGVRYTPPPRRTFTTSYQQPTRSTSDNTRVVTPNVSDATRAMVADQRAREAAAKRSGVIYAGTPETSYQKAKRKSSFVEQAKQKDGFATPLDYVLDTVNPATYAFAATDLVGNQVSAVKNLAQGNFQEAGSDLLEAQMNALYLLPAISPAKSVARFATTQTPLKNTWKLNPRAYQYNLPENTMWRGLGQEGMEDAISSGLFRAKQNVVPRYHPGTKLQINKSFGTNPYFTPKFKTAATYGDNYLAEVPTDAANWKQRYARTDWSQIADRAIPISEGRILQKDWLRGYKPIDVPSARQSFKSEIDWAKWNPETATHKVLMDEYNAIEESTKKAGTWMKNSDGTAFQGTPEQFIQQQSSWFKKAFGNSKLVNPDGSPTIQYHGSAKKFDTFDESKFQLGDAGYSGKGIYTSPSKTTANSYAVSSAKFHKGDIEPTVYELYGQANNPISSSQLINENKGRDLFNFHRDRNWQGELSPYESLREYDAAISDQLTGVQNIRPWHDAREVVFPTNKQLKSAVGNVGFFDMTNPNIYKAVAPVGVGLGVGVSQLQEKKYGGWLEEYQVGGRPIYTSNPNDPRLRSYNDSFNLYSKTKSVRDYPNYIVGSRMVPYKSNTRYFNAYGNTLISNFPKIKPTHSMLIDDVPMNPIYARPVQPVIYKKPTVPKVYKKLESTPKVVKASIPVPTSTPIIENVLPVPVVQPSKPSLVATNIDLDMYPTGTGMASDYRYGVVLEDGTRKLFNTKKEYDEWKALNNLDISKAQINQGKGYTTMYYPENKKYGGWLNKYK